ncbi:protein FAM246C-like [Schistocerca piceifrons]|uniref:protein FAM246C-like n=1 Tax=Schistocerca piceifrons TaxID=274613 RepID=UPI001F5E722D|nr:protein FAM246C-like [Schistocerca piceifrons]
MRGRRQRGSGQWATRRAERRSLGVRGLARRQPGLRAEAAAGQLVPVGCRLLRVTRRGGARDLAVERRGGNRQRRPCRRQRGAAPAAATAPDTEAGAHVGAGEAASHQLLARGRSAHVAGTWVPCYAGTPPRRWSGVRELCLYGWQLAVGGAAPPPAPIYSYLYTRTRPPTWAAHVPPPTPAPNMAAQGGRSAKNDAPTPRRYSQPLTQRRAEERPTPQPPCSLYWKTSPKRRRQK